MSNRMLTVMTLATLLGIGVLFLVNYSTPLAKTQTAQFLSPNQVRGSATERYGKLFFQTEKGLMIERFAGEIEKLLSDTYDKNS